MLVYKVAHITMSLVGALVLLVLVLLLPTIPITYLAASQVSIVVDTLDDELNNDGDCSLHEAIQAARTNSPMDACPAGSAITDTITFSVVGTILLDSSLLIQTGGPLVIDGDSTVILSGDAQSRIFVVYSGAELILQNLTLRDGYSGADGSAIYNDGTTRIENSTLSGNSAAGDGGAIYNSGIMDINSSTFYSNSNNVDATDNASGGAIYNSGTLSVKDSVFSDNSTLLINKYYSGGGGIFNSADAVLSVTHTQFLRNSAPMGGGIFTRGQANIHGGSFIGNTAFTGGGIAYFYVYTDTLVIITDSLLNDNHAIYHMGWDGGHTGGAIDFNGPVVIANTTISANTAHQRGGGINGSNRPLLFPIVLSHITLVNNYSEVYTTGQNISGGIFTIRNSIIAGGLEGQNCRFYWGVVDDGNNIEDANTCGFSPSNGSMPDTDPLLDDLDNNGGGTLTHALQVGSLAIDLAKPDYCPPSDQRGASRPYDGDGDGFAGCDIGAFELNPDAFPIQWFYLPILRKN